MAEIIVFAAGRRENVVVADTLVFPSHQVGSKRIALAIFAERQLGLSERYTSQAMTILTPNF